MEIIIFHFLQLQEHNEASYTSPEKGLVIDISRSIYFMLNYLK